MNFVPRPVMKSHSSHEDSRPLPGYESNKRGKWDRLHRRLAHSQPYLRVFTTSDRFIAEYLGVMLVMHKSVTLKYALEGRSTRTEEVPSVHQLPVYLVLDKGHQNARENEPATNTSQHVNGSHFGDPCRLCPAVPGVGHSDRRVQKHPCQIATHSSSPPLRGARDHVGCHTSRSMRRESAERGSSSSGFPPAAAG